LVPVETDEDTGEVLDGHHRIRACQELGLPPPPVKRRKFKTDDERREHAIALNIVRRQMGPVRWAEAFEQLLQVRGVKRGSGSRNDKRTCATVAQVAGELGVLKRTAYYRLELADALRKEPDLAAKVDAGEMTPKRALRVIREREAERKTMDEPAPEPSGDIDIRHCEISKFSVEERSVRLILTDPPYPKEFLGVWSELAAFAEKALVPGGMLVAYTGQYHLPEVISSLQERLEYVWIGSLLVPGHHNQVQNRKIRNASKPLLFFCKPPYDPVGWYEDTFVSEGKTKEHHEWEQSIGLARYYIEKLTRPGDLVCDPFLGGGTTAIAARDLGRSFVGCDIEKKAVDTTKRRFAET
jgi:hypothetical protein